MLLTLFNLAAASALANPALLEETRACFKRTLQTPTTPFTPGGSDDKPGSLSFAQLKRIIEQNNIRSVDDLVPHLGEHRDYWTPIYESESLHKPLTSPERPRYMLTGPDADFVITYVECPPGQRAGAYPDCEKVEIWEFNRAENRFEFKEIVFPGKTARASDRPRIDENPTSCANCHGTPPRPIWENYNLWPGVYGSLSRNEHDILAPGSNEARNYQRFIDRIRSGNVPARAKGLHFRELPRTLPYAVYNPPQNPDGSQPAPVPSAYYNTVHSKIKDPNSMVTELFSALTARAVPQALVNSERYYFMRFVLQAWAQDCQSWPAFMGDLLKTSDLPTRDNRAPQWILDRWKADHEKTVSLVDQQNRVRDDFWGPLSTQPNASVLPDLDTSKLAVLYEASGYRAEHALNSPTQKFDSTNPKTSPTATMARGQLENALKACDPTLQNLSCAELERRASAAYRRFVASKDPACTDPLAVLYPAQEEATASALEAVSVALEDDDDRYLRAMANAPRILLECRSCHTGDDSVADLPLDSVDALRAELRREGSDLRERLIDRLTRIEQGRRGVMPPGGATVEERAALRRWVEELR